MNSTFGKGLKLILTDNTSGSRQLVLKLNELFKSYYLNSEKIKNVIPQIRKKFSQFSSIENYLNLLEMHLAKNSKLSEDFFDSFEKNSNNLYGQIYKKASAYLSNLNTVITLSNSETILNILKLLKNDNPRLKVIVCESRPQCEGKFLAQQLAESLIEVEFITEAMIMQKLPVSDAVLLGADKILNDGTVINKIGSSILALAARYYNKPVYVLADNSKFGNESSFEPKEYSPKEIWDIKNEKINITNIYFEAVDKSLITKIFTEDEHRFLKSTSSKMDG